MAGRKPGTKLSEETKRKISLANKGRVVSAETRRKLSENRLGRKFPKLSAAKRGVPNPKNLGANHGLWKGSLVGDSCLHKWVARLKGKARFCELCGLDKLPPGKKKYFEWSNISGKYLRDLDDFWSLCRSCHAKYDNVITHITKPADGNQKDR